MKKKFLRLSMATLILTGLFASFLSVKAYAAEIVSVSIAGDVDSAKYGDRIEDYCERLHFTITPRGGEIGDFYIAICQGTEFDSFDEVLDNVIYKGHYFRDVVEFKEDQYYSIMLYIPSGEGSLYDPHISAPSGWNMFWGDYDSETGYPKCIILTRSVKFGSDDPAPAPCPTPKKATTNESKKIAEAVIVDRDMFKSEAPSKTVIAADFIGAKSFFDLKVHAADNQTQANQKLLAQYLIGPNAKILVTENIYPGRDLSITENGSLQVLTWNNLPKNQPGAIPAVVYNQIDGAYVIHGILDANGTATFTGFKLRPASTITICK